MLGVTDTTGGGRADAMAHLLDLAAAVAELAMDIYGGARELSTAQAMGLLQARRRARRLIGLAGTHLLAAFAPHLGAADLADAERRLKDLAAAGLRFLDWAVRNRGLAPPSWDPPDSNDVEDHLNCAPEWPAATMRAERERAALWREVARARMRVELLRGPAEPRQGPVPPDKFKWGPATAECLPLLQYRLLDALCSGERLRDPVPIDEVIATVTRRAA